MSTPLILAIDQGTTGSTCLLVDSNLRVRARATHDFPQHFPSPGLVEHDPEELWTSVLHGIRDVCAAMEASGEAHEIVAIGITNQRETSLIWSRETGAPIHKALVWQDRRTADRCEELRAQGHEALIRERTGLVLDPYFSATKLAWTLDNVEGARDAAARGELAAGTIDTYILWRLTNGASHATEPSNASRTMLWPLQGRAGSEGGWDLELCELLRVPVSLLPSVHPCTHRFGETHDVPGLPDGIPIHGIAGDQQAALFGQACFARGEAKCTYGTGAFIMMNTGETPVASEHGLLTTVGWQIGDATTYCLEGSAFMAGAVVQWLRDELKFFATAPEIEAMASSVPDSGGVVLVPAHAGLGAPHWRPDARGMLCGLTRGSSRAHIARAALEGIALQVGDLVRAMVADLDATRSGDDLEKLQLQRLRVDGGAAANNLLMQIQADVLNAALDRPQMLETTALGAVFLAGLGCGLWEDQTALTNAWIKDRSFEPADDASAIDALQTRWRDAVDKS
jgi:glycerol kinase